MAPLLIALLFITGNCFTLNAAHGEDFPLGKVVLRTKTGNGRTEMNGRIVDYNGKYLRIQPAQSAKVITFLAERVIRVDTPQTKPHIAGLRAFLDNRNDDAINQFTKALEAEQRSWVLREIRAMLVRCALKRGDYSSAGLHFESIVNSDPESRHYKLIPLMWSDQRPELNLKHLANHWLAETNNSMKLIGASVLINDPKQSSLARRELHNLASKPDLRISSLAEAQLWRTRLKAKDLDRREVDRWESHLDRIPQNIRGGPYYVLGQALLRLQQHEQAAMTLLWVPLVYHDDHHLAARACLDSANALARIGQKNEAVTLYREIAHRFRETPYALRVSAKLESIFPTTSTTIENAPAAKQSKDDSH